MKELNIPVVKNVNELKELMEAFRKSGLGSLTLKQGDFFELMLENQKTEVISTAAPQIVQVAAAPQSTTAAVLVDDAPAAVRGNVMKSPIVGTYYAAPSPEKPVFIKVGQQVKKGDVLFIIESMKLMNEVTSEFDGVVAEIYVQNAQTVEYGQPILRIE